MGGKDSTNEFELKSFVYITRVATPDDSSHNYLINTEYDESFLTILGWSSRV